METNYFVVPAPGHYGDKAEVLSSHATLKSAQRATRRHTGVCIRQGHLRRGAAWYRSSEGVYGLAGGEQS